MNKRRILAAAFLLNAFFLFSTTTVTFGMTGYCSGCHTMHNSQNDLPMRYDSGTTPLAQLLRGDCYGCHAQGTGLSLYPIGVDNIPQVYHSGPSNLDLAGGNFAYIDGTAGTGASSSKGHNITDLYAMGPDSDLYGPPGGIVQGFHDDGGNVNTNNLRCAGTNGCHGNRYYPSDPNYEGISGAHHDNWNGQVDPPAIDPEPGHGFRFLVGTKGYEDTDWQFNATSTEHNEYFGIGTPVSLGCSAALTCHGNGGIRPPNGTISEFCGTCHGNFHTLATSTSSGVGSIAASPFIRHPSDFSLPITGEYGGYNTYSPDNPVARIGAVRAGSTSAREAGDAVMCLSCHNAHGSDYDDMLKWNYADMVVGGGATNGCFACHTGKN